MVLKTIADVPPGGHFFGSPHTLERYRTAFYAPLVSDWRNHGAWIEAGAPTALDRATRIWQEKLAAFSPPRSTPGSPPGCKPSFRRGKARRASKFHYIKVTGIRTDAGLPGGHYFDETSP